MGIIKDFLGQSEAERAALADDNDYYKRKVYFFELEFPRSLGGGPDKTVVFPLALNPQLYAISEPFTVERTPTLGGGLYVEENGVVYREIRLSGTTGAKFRSLSRGNASNLLDGRLDAKTKSYGRSLIPNVGVALSGQRHFQYLQDAIFRTYGDLKRNPATARETKLYFHNQKDDEHWLVVPEKFEGPRDKGSPITYRYDIQLLAVAPATQKTFEFEQDKSWIDVVKNAQRYVKSGVDLASGALNDLTALTAELTNLVKGFGTIVDSMTTTLDAANNFVTGVSNLIESPVTLLNSTADLIETAMASREEIEQSVANARVLPDTVRQKFRQMEDGLERIMTHPESFESPAQQRLRENKKRQELLTSAGASAISSALTTEPATSLDLLDTRGTAISQGDAISADGILDAGRTSSDYTSTYEVVVTQGDTLSSLAQKYLSDPSRWVDIAIVNDLKPPFVDELATVPIDTTDEIPLYGAIGRGGKIRIPSFDAPPDALPELPTLGVRREESLEDHLLGTDFLLQRDPNSRLGAPKYDLVVDTEHGSTDVRLVSGIANLKQAVLTRLETERGTNLLYPRLGMRRAVGKKLVGTDILTRQFHATEALTQDPRIAAVKRISLTNASETNSTAGTDVLNIDADVSVRGFTSSVNIATTVG